MSTNTSFVQQYSCQTGNYTYYSFNSYYPADAFDTLSNGYIVLMNYYYIIRFTSTSDSYMVSYSSTANIFAASYKNNEFVYLTGNSNSSSSINVYYGSGSLGQSINYTGNVIKAVDATENYLAAVDVYGYLVISTYDRDHSYDGDFPGWAIGLIVGVIVIIFIIGAIVNVVKARKRRQAMNGNHYNQFNNDPIPQPYFPNQPSGQQTSANNFNPGPFVQSNQPWNANQPPVYVHTYNQPNQQPSQNPYQANQPRNWE